jgi:hypothetical protein
MLDIAVSFLADELNTYLRKRGELTGSLDVVLPTSLVDDKGVWTLPVGNIGLTLVNIEEERVLREQLPERVYLNGNNVVLQPVIKLNLIVLFAARFAPDTDGYKSSLKFLSHVFTFFQANPSFSADNSPGLNGNIEKLNVELLSYTPEQLNQTWAYLGSKYLPSAIYRVRMVSLQDIEPVEIGKPITTINAEVTVR